MNAQQGITPNEKIFGIYRQRFQIFHRSQMSNIYKDAIPLTAEYGWSKDPVPFKDRLKLDYKPVHQGMTWAHEWESAWFHLTAVVPEEFEGKELCLRIHVGGESCVFANDGTPVYGLTCHSAFDTNYYKDRFVIGKVKPGTKLEYWVEGAANGLFGINQPSIYDKNPAKPWGQYTAVVQHLDLCVFDRDLYTMLLDFRVLDELIDVFGSKDYRGKQLCETLTRAMDLYNYNPDNAVKVHEYLTDKWLGHPASASALTACCVGHAHIDVGWLWPVRESIRKAARTFSSQLALMKEYPDYIFGASQAELYKMTKDNYPTLYSQIKKRIKEGRWEIQGGWWVEADCNIISGESMVRQFLHGKNFFMDEFGVDVKNLWIPDVFGYSASLPQIILKAGCKFFLTQKISWSQVNVFPHNTFRWIGVDGSEVITHFPPEDTYNASCQPHERIDGANRFKEAGYLNEFVSLMGIGDGGGGPSERYLEFNKRTANLEGCPKAIYKRTDKFFEDLALHKDELPVWNGELYLELHRGTLTTQAHTKRNNRKCEQALTALEFLASCLPPEQYPAEKLDWAWKKLLLNQFHDIIPGSSIGLVYQTTEKEHAQILELCKDEMEQAAKKLFIPYQYSAVLVNSLSVPWKGCITLPSDWKDQEIVNDDGREFDTQLEGDAVVAYVEIPASSFMTLRKSYEEKTPEVNSYDSFVLENHEVRYTFDSQGQLISAIDKNDNREIMSAPGNVLSLYIDHPNNHEAWDVEMFYPHDFLMNLKCVKAEKALYGPARSFIKFTFEGPNSKLTQTVYLNSQGKRLDFVTHVDWHESRTMLRTAFPVNITADSATFDIQYAFVKRPTHDNTSWDEAKFETAGQRYADLSQDDYGVALLNDCKYGYRVKGNILDLNLLRSPKHPDYTADMGEHDFTYSFFPHDGNHIEGKVPQEAAVLNREVSIFNGYRNEKAISPCTIYAGHANLEVVKKAEKDDSIIVRIVENAGKHGDVLLKLADWRMKVSETNLIEWEHGNTLPVNSNSEVVLSLKPFDIITLRLER